MDEVRIVKKEDGSYEVTIKGETITLPAGSTMKEDKKAGALTYGTPEKRILLVQGGDVVLAEGDDKRVLVEGGDGGLEISEAFPGEWNQAENPEGGRRHSRINRKTRRSKRKSRNLKRNKLRKLSTRRR